MTAAPPHAAIATALSDWFAANQRALPWRETRTAYRVWLSEIMCQQTQVAVVEGYFARFIARFPTVHALAAASEDEVLSLWSGLGYYSRGRNVHKAARYVVDTLGGQFPDTEAGLRALPGVGPYTAAAVACFAFGHRSTVVDGNVMRVYARVFDVQDAVNAAPGRARIDAEAAAVVAASENAALVNEGVMELGALVCAPKSPKCSACPLAAHCRAHARGTTRERPVKKPKKKRTVVHVAALLATHGDRVWLEKRAETRLFGGLYEPPSVTLEDADAAESALVELAAARGLPAEPGPIVHIKRVLTHRELHFYAMHVPLPDEAAPPSDAWVPLAEVAQRGISSAVGAVFKKTVPAIGAFFETRPPRG